MGKPARRRIDLGLEQTPWTPHRLPVDCLRNYRAIAARRVSAIFFSVPGYGAGYCGWHACSLLTPEYRDA